MLKARPDENNAFFAAAFGKVAVLTQEAIAGVDSVNIVLMRNADNVLNIKVSVNRPLALADEVSFVSLVAVQAGTEYLLWNKLLLCGCQARCRHGKRG